MNSFDNVLTQVFQQGAEIRLDLAEEMTAIEAAKAGDEKATLDLLFAYAPALRNAVKRYREALDRDDAQAEAVSSFLGAVRDFDATKGERLAGIVASRIGHDLGILAAAGSTFAIPERTLSRFYGILRRSGGDVEAAADSATEYGMARETFLSVLAHVRQTDSLDGISEGPDGEGRDARAASLWGASAPMADAEDRILAEIAFGAVDEVESQVCGLAYGFTDYDLVPDAEIAHRLGMTRSTVQRRRTSALDKMRDALGA